jgi:hypothetical protein
MGVYLYLPTRRWFSNKATNKPGGKILPLAKRSVLNFPALMQRLVCVCIFPACRLKVENKEHEYSNKREVHTLAKCVCTFETISAGGKQLLQWQKTSNACLRQDMQRE